MNKKVFFNIFVFLVFLTLLTPLLNFKDLLFPFVTSKAFYFRIVVELALPFYVWLLLTNKNLRPNIKSPLNAAVLLFFLANFISALFGVNLLKSFLGNLERMGGVFYLLHLTLFYFYLEFIAKKDSAIIERFLKGLVLFAALISLNGISGSFGGPVLVKDFSLPLRVSSTLGNPIFLASFLILPLCFSIIFYLQSENSRAKAAYVVAIALQISALYLSGTRGAFVGVIAGCALGIFLYLLFSKQNKTRRVGFISGGILVAVIGLLFVFSSKLPETSVLKRLTSLNDSNTQARLIQWSVALTGFKDRPIFGTGPENYYVIENLNYNPKQYTYDTSWFDKPHNFLLEVLATTGILGFVSYLGLLAAAFWVLFKAFKEELLTLGEYAILSGGFFAYQIQNLFAFDTVSASITFFVFLGFCAYLLITKTQDEKKNKHYSEIPWANSLFFLILIASIYSIYVLNILPMNFSKKINEGLFYYSQSAEPDYEKSKNAFDAARGMNLNYDDNELFLKYSDMALSAAQTSDAVTKDFILQASQGAYDLGEHITKSNSTNPVVWYYLAALQHFESIVNKTPLPKSAVDNLSKALELAPNRPEILYLDVQFKAALGELEAALVKAQEYSSLYPKFGQATWQVGFVNYKMGNLSEAVKYAEEAIAQGYKLESLKETNILIDYYKQQKNFSKVVELYKEAMKYDSQNVLVYLGLVEAYENNGQNSEARELAKQIVDSDASYADELSKWIK